MRNILKSIRAADHFAYSDTSMRYQPQECKTTTVKSFKVVFSSVSSSLERLANIGLDHLI